MREVLGWHRSDITSIVENLQQWDPDGDKEYNPSPKRMALVLSKPRRGNRLNEAEKINNDWSKKQEG